MQNSKFKMLKGWLAMLAGLGVFFSACSNEAPQKQPEVTQGNPQIEEGKAIFRQNCTTCHLMQANAAGPALQGVLTRWDGDSAAMRAYIRNPSASIEAKEPHALKAWEKYKPTVMPAFPNFSDGELNALIAYLQRGQ